MQVLKFEQEEQLHPAKDTIRTTETDIRGEVRVTYLRDSSNKINTSFNTLDSLMLHSEALKHGVVRLSALGHAQHAGALDESVADFKPHFVH